MTGMAQVRPYRGIGAAERLDQRRRRLVEAGLDLLGADSPETELTVRAVCKRSSVFVSSPCSCRKFWFAFRSG